MTLPLNASRLPAMLLLERTAAQLWRGGIDDQDRVPRQTLSRVRRAGADARLRGGIVAVEFLRMVRICLRRLRLPGGWGGLLLMLALMEPKKCGTAAQTANVDSLPARRTFGFRGRLLPAFR